MNGFALLLAAALLGVDYGWQPASDGRLEYIVQIEPVTLIALREGQEVVSQIDPLARGVRRFRIRVGTDVVPRLGTPPQEPANTTSTASPAPPGVIYGWQPFGEQQLEFLVQIAPERLAVLAKEPITGELPPELGNVSRIRIRPGTGNLPRQDLPQASGPLASDPPRDAQAAAARPGDPSVPVADSRTGAPVANAPASSGVSANATAPGSSWGPDNRGNAIRQPSRYDPPPAGAAASEPTAARASPQPQGDSWQPPAGQNSSWPAGQPAAAGSVAAVPPTGSPAPNTAPPAGLADPGVQPAWGSGMAAPSHTAAGQLPANLSPPWGTPDDRFTTERGQSPGGNSPNAPAAPAGTGWVPLVSLPASNAPPPESPSYANSPGSSWSPPAAGPAPGGEMVSPFFQSSPTTGTPLGSWAPVTQPPWQTQGNALTEASLSTAANRTKPRDFWADLAEAAEEPSGEFLRQPGREEQQTEKPWMPLTLAVLALFASMGGNLYLGWIAVDVYRRYLELTEEDDDDDESYDAPRGRDERREWDERPRRRERVAMED